MPKITVGIPTWEYNGQGDLLLNKSLAILSQQTFADFDVCISDHSKDDAVENICMDWMDDLDINYYRNERGRGSVAPNLNNILDHAEGEIIKLLDQDDYLLGSDSLQFYADYFDTETNFLATAYWHTRDRKEYYNLHLPMFNPQLFVVNTIGTCSCVAFRNFGPETPRFDENLRYSHDCDWYWRYLMKYGKPVLLNVPTIANYLWENSVTSTVSNELILSEQKYILDKIYKEKR